MRMRDNLSILPDFSGAYNIAYDAHREQYGRARSHVCLRLIQRVHDSEAFLSPLNRDAMVEWLIAPGSE